MADDNRSEANLKHFKSRSQQPNVWKSSTPSPVQVFVVYDQGFSGQVDDMRFKYLGTSPQVSRYEQMCGRNLSQRLMGEHA